MSEEGGGGGAVLDTMSVELMGDAVHYHKTLDVALEALQTATAAMVSSMDKAEDRIKDFAAGALIARAIETVASKFKQFGQDAVDGFAEAELAEVKLRGALQSNHREVETTMASYQAFAAQLQKNVVVEDDAVIAMFQVAESLDVTGDAAKRAIKNAIALAAAKGGEASSYIRMTTALEQGNSEMLGRHLPALRAIKDDTERAAKAHEMLGNMFGVAEAEVNTFSGAMRTAKIAFGNALEVIGKVVAEAIKPLVVWVRQASEWFQTLAPETIAIAAKIGMVTVAVAGLIAAWGPITAAIAGVGTVAAAVFSPIGIAIAAVTAAVYLTIDALGGLEATWELIKQAAMSFWDFVKPVFIQLGDVAIAAFQMIWEACKTAFEAIKEIVMSIWTAIGGKTKQTFSDMRDWITDALIMAEFTFKNFGRVMEFVWVSAAYQVVKFANEVVHLFTEEIPTYLAWFGRATIQLWSQVWENAKQIFSNFGQSIVSFWKNFPDLIKGNMSLGDIWVPLTQGLTDVFTEALPDVIKRQAGPLERQLKKQSEELADSLGVDYSKFRDEKRKKLFGPVVEASTDAVKNAEKTGFDLGNAAAKGVGKGMNENKADAAAFGSLEAIRRLMAYQDFLDSMRSKNKKAAVANGGKDPAVAAAEAASPRANGNIPGHVPFEAAFGPGLNAVNAGNGEKTLQTISTGITRLVSLEEKKAAIELVPAGL